MTEDGKLRSVTLLWLLSESGLWACWTHTMAGAGTSRIFNSQFWALMVPSCLFCGLCVSISLASLLAHLSLWLTDVMQFLRCPGAARWHAELLSYYARESSKNPCRANMPSVALKHGPVEAPPPLVPCWLALWETNQFTAPPPIQACATPALETTLLRRLE